MRTLARIVLPPAVAAALVVAFELARTLAGGTTDLGGASGVLGFAAALAGLLGFPLWALGVAALGLFAATRAGWTWGRGDLPPALPARRAAWVVFAGLGLAVLVLVVQGRTIHYIEAFRRPVYQGLAAGLSAAAVVVLLAALSGPVVGLLARMFAALGRRLPAFADPTRPRGAALLGGTLVLAAVLLAPVVFQELHTVDLRAPRLALAWLAVLAAAVALAPRMVGPRAGLAIGAGLGLVFAAGLGWSAAALGKSPSRLLALDRDTLLAATVSAAMRRLADRDGDGVPRLFGGGDCDDHDPAVRPGVYDIPDDRIDQNCTGADLRLSQDPAAAARHPAAPAAPTHRWNVLLLTVDAVRHDAMAQFMPRLSALAAEGVDYRNAYSHAAATYWSLAALITGKLPSRVRFSGDQTPVDDERVLAEVLKDAGWHTALFANVTVFFIRGLRQGFEVADYETSHFTVHGEKPGAEHLTSGVLKHLEGLPRGPEAKPFFLWAHYYDPHDPYSPIPGYPAADGSDRALYDQNVRYTDAEIGRLLDGIEKMGLWDETLVIVTADHGDEFLDHGHRFHGGSVYEEMTHVPLVLHVPGVEPRALETPIGHDEIGSTLLELLGLPIPKTFAGRSRAQEILTGEPASVQPVWLEVLPDRNYDGHLVGMVLGRTKLVYRIEENYFELYDLDTDPGERRNLYGVDPRTPELAERLLRFTDHHLYAVAQGRTGADLPPGAPKPGSKPKPRPKAAK